MTSDQQCVAGRQPTLPRFLVIEGLRAWMAWIVVLSHIVQQAGLRDGGGLWRQMFRAGSWGVAVFIIISGFVITHLLEGRGETYRSYIFRRFMRLFPAYLVCLLLGICAYELSYQFADPSWFDQIHRGHYDAAAASPVAHLLLHLTMLHGAVPNPVLDLSQYAYLPTAWSVSLEWQFYLVAPVVVAILGDRKWRPWLLLAAFAMAVFYQHVLAGWWRQPSALIGPFQYFLLGALSRQVMPALSGKLRWITLWAAVSVAAGFVLSRYAMGFARNGWIAVGIWGAVMCFLCRARDEQGVLFRHMLEARPVLWLAQRSYSTYLLHWPVIMIVGTVVTARTSLAGAELAGALTLTVPVVLILQEPLYRLVELPFQRWAKRFAVRLGEQPVKQLRLA